MADPQIQELISEAPDGFEIVRDKIADILKVESASQEAKANEAGKDSRLWALRVFTEVTNPLEMFRDPPDPAKGEEARSFAPVVNVWFDKATYDKSSSDAVNRQTADGVFHCDCFGYGIATSEGDGHTPGDLAAALESQRAARLVRRILMSGYYINLGLLKLVGERFPTALESLRVHGDDNRSTQVACTRFSLGVRFIEQAPQYLAQLLEQIVFSARRSEGGELLYSVTLDFPSS